MMATRQSSGPSTDNHAARDVRELPEQLASRYTVIRRRSDALCDPLATEDYVVQSMTEASPVSWHLAHTTWFFETFVLAHAVADYRPHHPQFGYLFNSYYEGAGTRHPRPARGMLTRPTVHQVYEYRQAVDAHVADFLAGCSADDPRLPVVEVGLQHEQQHQELMLTDLKHLFSLNPLRPAYQSAAETAASAHSGQVGWQRFPTDTVWIGHSGPGFAYDNEQPRHQEFQQGFEIAGRLATCGEYLHFIEDGGYRRPELWLSDGWQAVCENDWSAPLYWERHDGRWHLFTLSGLQPFCAAEPVCHLSFFEADAFARWSGARLPSEAEWEVAATASLAAGDPLETANFAENGRFHPLPATAGETESWFGNAWQWTASPYVAYPGFRPLQGTLGEYNGKFMCSQIVLRGGSCVTPRSHIRPTYRNFFYPDARWQFSTVRLARDCAPDA